MRVRVLALVGLTTFAPIILAALVHAQRSTREVIYAPRGPVRTMRVEEANVIAKDGEFVEGPRVLRMTALFNEHGAGRGWLRGVTLYDRDGHIKEKATFNADGSLQSKTTYKRNEKGAIVESAEADANGTVLDKFVYTYDDAGQLKGSERTQYRRDGSVSAKEFRNSAAKRIESVAYNRDGSIARRSVRVDEQINEFGPEGSLQKTTQITNPGRLPSESLHNPDGSVTKQSQIIDKTDRYGNWIKQTEWITDSKGTRPVKVAYRVLTYYHPRS